MTDRFPTLHVASAMTGVALCDGLSISRMQEISERLVGHSVWTHEFAHPGMRDHICRAGMRLFPLMPDCHEARENWQRAAARAEAIYGEWVELPLVARSRAVSPETTLVEVIDRGSTTTKFTE